MELVTMTDAIFFEECMQKHGVLVELLYASVSAKRAEHCKRVAVHCVQLAYKHAVDREHAFLAGIAHDLCREWTDKQLVETAEAESIVMEAYERDEPVLLHGKIAPYVLAQKYPMHQCVYDAIAVHTLGCVQTTDLQKVLYIADALDDERPLWQTPQGRSAWRDILHQATLENMMDTLIEHMMQRYDIHPLTRAMQRSIQSTPSL